MRPILAPSLVVFQGWFSSAPHAIGGALFLELLSFDVTLFERINGSQWASTLGELFLWLTKGGDMRFVVPAVILMSLWRWRKTWRIRVGTLLLAFALSGLVSVAIKVSVDRPRPPLNAGLEACEDQGPTGLTPAHQTQVRGPVLCRRSFPSGHTQVAFSWMFALALTTPRSGRRKWLAVAGIGGTIVALSRVVLGVHYPLDILFGGIIGLAGAFAARSIVARCWPRAFKESVGEEYVAPR